MTERHDEPSSGRAEARESAERADAGARWSDPPTHKARAGVHRAVDRLLDALAPERTVVRAARPPQPIERYRTPRGCILQARAAAVTVSWFVDSAAESAFGELQVLVWHGVVSRPGATHRAPGGARIARALVLRPEEREAPADVEAEEGEAVTAAATEWKWRADDGTGYDSDALAAYCLALLERQIAAA